MVYTRFDEQYKTLAKEVLTKGTLVKGRNDLEYLQVFGQDFCVDLRLEFPALTLRRLPIQNLFREFMWDVKGQSDVNSLGKAKHFWDFLSFGDGYLPASYGSSWRSWPINIPNTVGEAIHKVFNNDPVDQLAYIHKELKNNPTNRQLVLTTLNPAYKREVMKCPPCHPCVIFSSDGNHLDSLVIARSNDFAVGIPLDAVRYAALTIKLAQDSKLKPRFMKFSSANNHIYLKNKAEMETLISREPKEDVSLLWTNPLKSLFDLDPEEDIKLIDYVSHAPIKFEVAK